MTKIVTFTFYFCFLLCADRNIWDRKEPLPSQIHKGESVYDYYDILEPLGRHVHTFLLIAPTFVFRCWCQIPINIRLYTFEVGFEK